jgi:hypothetical protein
VTFEARRLFAERPEPDALRARVEAIELLPRGGGFRPTGRYSFETLRHRSELRR